MVTDEVNKNSSHHLNNCSFLFGKYSLFQKNKRILDVECGNGYYSAEIAKHVPDGTVTAIASKAIHIKQARRQYIDIKNLSFQACDIYKFCDGQGFDLITSLNDLFQYQNKQTVFKCIRRALKPQGKALFVCYPNDFYWKLICEHCQTTTWKGYFKDFEPKYYFSEPLRYKHFFKVAGLTIEDSCLLPSKLEFKTQSDYILYLNGWLPHLQMLPNHSHNRFLTEIADITARQSGKSAVHAIQIPLMRIEFLVCPKKA